MLYHYMTDTPVGCLRLGAEGAALCEILFWDAPAGAGADTPLFAETERQLREYFRGGRQTFALPLAPAGTAFQQRVWAALCEIPYGETRSYAQLAAAAGSPRAYRAAGQANHRNPLPIVIPCHRVIAADGTLGGYGGGLERKRTLLRLEEPRGATGR